MMKFTVCIYFLVIFVWILVRYQYLKQYFTTHQHKKTTYHQKREVLWVQFICFNTTFAIFIWFLPYFKFANYELSNFFDAFGINLSLLSAWLFYKSHQDLGKNWSPLLEIRQEHYLITTGLYQYVRHPMYFAVLVWTFANLFLLENWLIWTLQSFPIFLMLWIRIPDEEKMLAEQFGNQYKIYQTKTKILIPFLF